MLLFAGFLGFYLVEMKQLKLENEMFCCSVIFQVRTIKEISAESTRTQRAQTKFTQTQYVQTESAQSSSAPAHHQSALPVLSLTIVSLKSHFTLS